MILKCIFLQNVIDTRLTLQRIHSFILTSLKLWMQCKSESLKLVLFGTLKQCYCEQGRKQVRAKVKTSTREKRLEQGDESSKGKRRRRRKGKDRLGIERRRRQKASADWSRESGCRRCKKWFWRSRRWFGYRNQKSHFKVKAGERPGSQAEGTINREAESYLLYLYLHLLFCLWLLCECACDHNSSIARLPAVSVTIS